MDIQLALEKKESAIKLRQLEGVFRFWLCGIGFAVVAFVFEISVYHYRIQKFRLKQRKKRKEVRHLYLK